MPPTTTGSSVVYASEKLSTLWDELMPLLERHRAEVSHYPQDVLAPNCAMYDRAEQADGLRTYTARDLNLSLIGYLVFVFGPNPHYTGTIMASCDVIYVVPHERKGGVGIGLMQFAKNRLIEDGCQVISMRTKVRKGLYFGHLLKVLGYECVDETWLMRVA